MNTPFAQTHFDEAKNLYRQRLSLLSRYEFGAGVLKNLEYRLRLHLHVLSRCEENGEAPKKAPDAFVQLASRLSSPDGERVAEGRKMALECLQQGGAVQVGAYHALVLFPPECGEAEEDLLEVYRRCGELRPMLFRLWRAQGVKVPAALHNSAELQGRDPDLQIAALEYAADRPDVGVELFRCRYQPLLARQISELPVGASAALRGGLLRGDSEVGQALRRGIELEGKGPLLRLAALSGDPQFYQILKQVMETCPAEGIPLMALYGRVEILPDLLLALDQAAAMECAAEAWKRLTGQALPRKSRLSVVGSEKSSSEESMPNGETASAWWSEKKRDFRPEDRLFRGEHLSSALLENLLDSLAGQVRWDLLDLLALQRGNPLGIIPDGWLSFQARDVERWARKEKEGSRFNSSGEGKHA